MRRRWGGARARRMAELGSHFAPAVFAVPPPIELDRDAAHAAVLIVSPA